MENYIGKRLDGRYEIMEIIGVGGMAVVYKAFDNLDQRIVAVKILKDEFIANEEFKRRFKNESKAIAVLSHENIVRVFDVSYGDMLQYIVMEYVDGITLKEYMQQQGKVNPKEAIYFVTQILRALQHAHDKGIVHRDVKPQNIMLQSNGTIKVTDFGIARFSRSETRTMTDCAIGSVHYISPEQAKGNVTDAKTDLYAVGVVLYEMLTGSLPFQSDNAVSVALMQLQKEPVMPRQLNPDIAIGLEQIIMKAMQKNINDRYQSASEILFDIERFKRNPNIKFDYAFVATGKVNISENAEIPEVKTSGNTGAPVRRPQNQNRPVRRNPAMSRKAAAELKRKKELERKAKTRTLFMLFGVLVILTVSAVFLINFFGGNKNSFVVPTLVGYNYYEDIVDNPEYTDLNIVAKFRDDSVETAGKILEQEPEAGKKVEYGTSITVYISAAGTGIEIPSDIIGKNFSAAETQLKTLGFMVETLKEKNENVKVGSVLRTEPQVGTKANPGSKITIYVATNEDVEPVAVPDLLGKTTDEAKAALEAVGLVLNSDAIEYRNSAADAGTIIGYEKVGEMVLPGTSIAVYLSNGNSSSVEDTTKESTTDATTTTNILEYDDSSYDTGEEEDYESEDVHEITIYIPTEAVEDDSSADEDYSADEEESE